MVKLLGISGSLRKQSLNTALLHAAQGLELPGVELSVELSVATLHGIPLYDGDLEQASGIPAAVTTLKQKIQASDGVILATPEYNHGIPGVFKNAIDWLSRPPAEMAALFHNRPFALVGATPSGFGTALSQDAWLSVLHALGVRTWAGGNLLLSRAPQAFDDQGKLTEEPRKQLQQFLQGFAKFAQAQA